MRHTALYPSGLDTLYSLFRLLTVFLLRPFSPFILDIDVDVDIDIELKYNHPFLSLSLSPTHYTILTQHLTLLPLSIYLPPPHLT